MAKMKKSAIIWLIVAASLVVLGIFLIAVSIAVAEFEPSGFSTVQYETNSYEIDGEFENISIKSNTADIKVVPSDDGEYSVVCREQQNLKHTVEVKDGTLVIKLEDTRKWYEHIGIGFGDTSVTVYLPDGVYGDLSVNIDTGDTEIGSDLLFESIDIDSDTGDVTAYAWTTGTLKIKTTTGKITVDNAHAGELDLTASTGDIKVKDVNCVGEIAHKCTTGKSVFENVNCESLVSEGSTGDITAKNVIASKKFSIERSTGDVRFDGSDAAEIYVQTDTGDVEGSLLTEKVFLVETDTGDVRVPSSVTGGRCEITTDTGDIEISVKN